MNKFRGLHHLTNQDAVEGKSPLKLTHVPERNHEIVFRPVSKQAPKPLYLHDCSICCVLGQWSWLGMAHLRIAAALFGLDLVHDQEEQGK